MLPWERSRGLKLGGIGLSMAVQISGAAGIVLGVETWRGVEGGRGKIAGGAMGGEKPSCRGALASCCWCPWRGCCCAVERRARHREEGRGARPQGEGATTGHHGRRRGAVEGMEQRASANGTSIVERSARELDDARKKFFCAPRRPSKRQGAG
jgi:hypothetical protein